VLPTTDESFINKSCFRMTSHISEVHSIVTALKINAVTVFHNLLITKAVFTTEINNCAYYTLISYTNPSLCCNDVII